MWVYGSNLNVGIDLYLLCVFIVDELLSFKWVVGIGVCVSFVFVVCELLFVVFVVV